MNTDAFRADPPPYVCTHLTSYGTPERAILVVAHYLPGPAWARGLLASRPRKA